ncbi:hypothetical protein M9Y10_035696 [Tritrichomonas musculus]|uniref:Peptidase S9 prolyl oligopeptidase catalytic domain-containing protein n=1 Tax=Tritrichomonas musculus TaxID=1915356 RepID=A0ABR2GWG6_9EUKA
MSSDSTFYINNFKKIDKRPNPTGGLFINENLVHLNFSSPNHLLGRTETSVTQVKLHSEGSQIIPIHNDSEKLVGFSYDGRTRAAIRSIPFSSTMPIGTPKITKGEQSNVVFLEVFKDSELISNEILTEENGDFQTHPTITSGLLVSPNSRYIAWIAATKKKDARKSLLGYKVKTYDYRDYGEDIDGVYGTNLVIFDTETSNTKVIGSPEKHGACKFTFASENIIVLQAVDLTSPQIAGIRSYQNRPFHLFAVDISNTEKIEFKPLLNDQSKIYLNPKAFEVKSDNNEKYSRIYIERFVDDFGGHNGPSHFASFKLNLNDLTASEYKESKELYQVVQVPYHPFIDEKTVCITISERCSINPIIINLDTFETRQLIEGTKAAVYVDDYRNGKYLIRTSSLTETGRYAILTNDEIEYLTESTKFEELQSKILLNDNYNDALLIIAPGEKKKFIVSPHGGPHGNYANSFVREYAFFALCGYSIALVNYRGSIAYPIDVQKSLPGHCGDQDVKDCVDIISQIKDQFPVEKVGIYGHSHGGYLSSHMAGQHPELIDFSVASAPVTNFVSSYYTCDIPDWALYESGVRRECDGDWEMDEESFHKMWMASSVRFAKNAKVPLLLIHGRKDRRVDMIQAVDFYLAMKRNGNPVKMILYDLVGHSVKLSSCNDDRLVNIIEFANDPKAYLEKDDNEFYEE